MNNKKNIKQSATANLILSDSLHEFGAIGGFFQFHYPSAMLREGIRFYWSDI